MSWEDIIKEMDIDEIHYESSLAHHIGVLCIQLENATRNGMVTVSKLEEIFNQHGGITFDADAFMEDRY
tara:strand:+ start:384 stop:590 length:207 start_codon:yes stop_codon:yes gene_type:complete